MARRVRYRGLGPTTSWCYLTLEFTNVLPVRIVLHSNYHPKRLLTGVDPC